MEQQFMPHGSSGWAAILCPGPDGGNYLMSHAHMFTCFLFSLNNDLRKADGTCLLSDSMFTTAWRNDAKTDLKTNYDSCF